MHMFEVRAHTPAAPLVAEGSGLRTLALAVNLCDSLSLSHGKKKWFLYSITADRCRRINVEEESNTTHPEEALS